MRHSTYRTTSVQIIGTLAGHIWMPGTVATKEVCYTMNVEHTTLRPASLTVEPETLREALCSIISTGDFQNCGLLYGAIIKVIRVNNVGTKRVRRWRIRFACWETEDIVSDIEAEEIGKTLLHMDLSTVWRSISFDEDGNEHVSFSSGGAIQ